MEKKYIFIGAVIIIAGLGYYYYDDINNYVDFNQQKEKIEEYANKKIKSKPVNINIENLNEL
jgi:uncharacterized membrane protein